MQQMTLTGTLKICILLFKQQKFIRQASINKVTQLILECEKIVWFICILILNNLI